MCVCVLISQHMITHLVRKQNYKIHVMNFLICSHHAIVLYTILFFLIPEVVTKVVMKKTLIIQHTVQNCLLAPSQCKVFFFFFIVGNMHIGSPSSHYSIWYTKLFSDNLLKECMNEKKKDRQNLLFIEHLLGREMCVCAGHFSNHILDSHNSTRYTFYLPCYRRRNIFSRYQVDNQHTSNCLTGIPTVRDLSTISL